MEIQSSTRNKFEKQTQLPESQAHLRIKNEIVNYFKEIGVEAYSEFVFYVKALSDFYEWEKQEKRRNPYSIILGHYKPGYGQEIRVDVAGFVDDSRGKFAYPVVAVEVMQSSNLRDVINELKNCMA